MRMVKHLDPSAGVSRLLLRIPVYLYRIGCGWLFADRLLLLHHVGRITGRPRRTVLEVVDHDRTTGSYVVASGWGTGAAWYRNVIAAPEVSIQVGRRTFPVIAAALSESDGAEVFARYAARHRTLARYVLPHLLGLPVDGSDTDFRALGRRLPFIQFVPRGSRPNGQGDRDDPHDSSSAVDEKSTG
ncbi:nitroreductase [Mycolicibacterium aromaticivorans JS19b1 = JCM 16368]|uniref:Nitroreductase n=2 Tax=Mycolicibacterium aromaticivorans TaxID=318425 RepID=A0A064CG80_9MYCO|nr:nitroreductase [Mycolicibacterium aromaticivorans JS19b1 = JCM 16368]